jgi:hypothetical protein
VLSLAKVCDDFVAVCVFKHAISPIQLQKITSFDFVEEICVLYDSDSTTNAWLEVGGRVINRVQASVAKMPLPEGRKKADPNDDALLAVEALNNRQLYTPAAALSSLLE